ncbi:hypothetical protein, partial [Serratia bockelmannii]
VPLFFRSPSLEDGKVQKLMRNGILLRCYRMGTAVNVHYLCQRGKQFVIFGYISRSQDYAAMLQMLCSINFRVLMICRFFVLIKSYTDFKQGYILLNCYFLAHQCMCGY